jgi:hypothetical protein
MLVVAARVCALQTTVYVQLALGLKLLYNALARSVVLRL